MEDEDNGDGEPDEVIVWKYLVKNIYIDNFIISNTANFCGNRAITARVKIKQLVLQSFSK